MKSRVGVIDISDLKIPPEKHELMTARVFAEMGKNIKFIKPSNVQGVHTPDFWMERRTWEVKSPMGKNIRGIESNFRDAAKQSENIIFDLRRSKIEESKAISKIRIEAEQFRVVKRVLVVTKNGNVLTIK